MKNIVVNYFYNLTDVIIFVFPVPIHVYNSLYIVPIYKNILCLRIKNKCFLLLLLLFVPFYRHTV